MIKRTRVYQAVAAALFLAAGASTPAFAVDVAEVEPNDRIFTDGRLTAQRLTIDRDGKVDVTAAIGVTDPAATPVPDVDFYAFDAQEGDRVMIDIDAGMKPFDLSVRSVDTLIAVFGPLPAVGLLRENNDTLATVPRDEGSEHIFDALIPEFRVPTTGTYVVGISSKPRSFLEGGGTSSTTVAGTAARFPNGSYKLRISGITLPVLVQPINIDIKPGNNTETYLNPKAKGTLPVALLSHRETKSSAAFDALTVDHGSLTFGSTGDEKSYLRCLKAGLDVNADGLPDLVCHFDNELGGWAAEDLEGVVKGKTADGKEFKGTARLKVKHKQSD
jgi:hypothetical protein